MERRLIVMRHATAVSGAGLATDHERSLTPRGTGEAERVARALLELGWLPQQALISDAARTSETWWVVAPIVREPPALMTRALYCVGVDALVGVLKRLEPEVGTVLALGHNPGWSDAISWLSGQQVRLAPSQAACLRGQGQRWSDALGYRSLELVTVVGP